MDNSVRIFRDKPFGWFDKPVMRYLRQKYGHNKRVFVSLRSVYLALCEIESDFNENSIPSFTKTVGAYAGVTREVAGRFINVLESEGLLSKTRLKDNAGHFTSGTIVILNSLQNQGLGLPKAKPSIAQDPQHRGSPALAKVGKYKKISNGKKIFNNVVENEKAEYYAMKIAQKLGDEKSISYYRLTCMRFNPEKLLQKAQEITADGGAKNPGAVFTSWIKTL